MALTSIGVDFLGAPPEEGVTRKQVDFLNKFGALHGLRHVPKRRDFDPKKVVGVVVHALRVTRRQLDLFLLRLRRLVHRVKILQRWFRQCLAQRELCFGKVLDRWIRSEDVQRKSVKLRIYRDCQVRKDFCRGMIDTYVSKLNVSTYRKKTAIKNLYWERRTQFREKFHAWWESYESLTAQVAGLERQRRVAFDPVEQKALDLKLGPLQEMVVHRGHARPRFQFDASCIRLSDLVSATALVLDTLSIELPEEDMCSLPGESPGEGPDSNLDHTSPTSLRPAMRAGGLLISPSLSPVAASRRLPRIRGFTPTLESPSRTSLGTGPRAIRTPTTPLSGGPSSFTTGGPIPAARSLQLIPPPARGSDDPRRRWSDMSPARPPLSLNAGQRLPNFPKSPVGCQAQVGATPVGLPHLCSLRRAKMS
eukprot:RCo013522